MEAIRLSGLTKYYGKTRGIENVELVVEEGAFFGFIGPNGAGKSTTIRTMLGLIRATAGSAQVFGKEIRENKLAVLQQVGYLPSEAEFYSGMRVKDVLKLSADLRKTDCTQEAQALCRRLQLDMTRKVDTLSYGNRKKVAIVCALQHCPRLLILDEPTGGLDPLMQKEFFDILRQRNKQGTTVFLSSHILSEVGRNCTRAAIIRDGRIIACDSVEALSKTNAKRVTFGGSAQLDGLKGIRDIKCTDEATSFLFSGDIKLLLQRLASGAVTDLTVTEPELDEVFLHYYEEGADAI